MCSFTYGSTLQHVPGSTTIQLYISEPGRDSNGTQKILLAILYGEISVIMLHLLLVVLAWTGDPTLCCPDDTLHKEPLYIACSLCIFF